MSRVVVVGSINVDVIATVPRIPTPGETVLGDSVGLHPGGKGANQAVAARRLGCDVLLVGGVGSDAFAPVSTSFLTSEGLSLEHVAVEPGPTGTALIAVDRGGENSIIVVPGANHGDWTSTAATAVSLRPGDIVLLQGEIPEDANLAVLRRARAAGCTTILNLAPYRPTDRASLDLIDFMVVNEPELARLLGLEPAGMGADRIAGLLADGTTLKADLIVTLGRDGVAARIGGTVRRIAGHPVKVVDTTGAGDCFCGAFAAGLAAGESVDAALENANWAAALSVTKAGAGPSLPTAAELALARHGA